MNMITDDALFYRSMNDCDRMIAARSHIRSLSHSLFVSRAQFQSNYVCATHKTTPTKSISFSFSFSIWSPRAFFFIPLAIFSTVTPLHIACYLLICTKPCANRQRDHCQIEKPQKKYRLDNWFCFFSTLAEPIRTD